MDNSSSWIEKLTGLSWIELQTMLFLNCIVYFMVLYLVTRNVDTSILLAIAITPLPLLVTIVSEKSTEEIIGMFGGIGVLLFFVAGLVLFSISYITALLSYAVWKPLVILFESVVATPTISAVIVSLAAILVIGSLLIAWKTGPAVDWSLSLRMAASPLVLTVLLIWFFITVWRLIEPTIRVGLTLLGIDPDTSAVVAKVVTVCLLATFVYLEYTRMSVVERHGNASPVPPDEYPTVHETTTKVASQLDVPKPTLAIAKHSDPEAITVGYRPGNVTLILSLGIIHTLDDEELEAVIAHELAHVANMDAMVMTLASLPNAFADGIANWVLDIGQADTSHRTDPDPPGFVSKLIVDARQNGYLTLLWFVPLLIPLLTKALSLPIITSLSRARESAADRTAATVCGSPAALASALRTLDEQIGETASEDLREASNLSLLSILPPPFHSIPTDISFEEFDGAEKLLSIFLTYIVMTFFIGFFGTHPPTERRIDALITLSAERDTEPER